MEQKLTYVITKYLFECKVLKLIESINDCFACEHIAHVKQREIKGQFLIRLKE